MNSCIQIHPDATVAVALQPIPAGSEYCGVIAQSDIPQGHKMAMQAMPQGSQVMKYGFSIGHATENIQPGKQNLSRLFAQRRQSRCPECNLDHSHCGVCERCRQGIGK